MTKPRVEVRLDGESVLLYDSVNNVPLGWVGLNRKNGFALAEAEDLAAFGNAVIGHALTLQPNPSAPSVGGHDITTFETVNLFYAGYGNKDVDIVVPCSLETPATFLVVDVEPCREQGFHWLFKVVCPNGLIRFISPSVLPFHGEYTQFRAWINGAKWQPRRDY